MMLWMWVHEVNGNLKLDKEKYEIGLCNCRSHFLPSNMRERMEKLLQLFACVALHQFNLLLLFFFPMIFCFLLSFIWDCLIFICAKHE